jgi:thymidine kinase
MADRARRKTAHCALCGRTADRTQRYTPIINEQMVAGRESYEPRCARCWREPVVAKQEVSSRSRELRSIEGNLRDDRPA